MVRQTRKTLVYLDANVLVPSLTRTLLLLAAARSDYQVIWSQYAEAEAERHQRSGAVAISTLRQRYGWKIVPDNESPVALQDTDSKDRPILSAAAMAHARFVITENVKDFGITDLAELSMSAVHPDLFLSARVSAQTYQATLTDMAAARTRAPNTAADIHAVEVGVKLPRLFATHRDLFTVEPTDPPSGAPKLSFRGVRCVRCATTLTDQQSKQLGLGPECRKQ